MAHRTPTRPAALRDALCALTRSLASARQGGVLSEALDVLLDALGCARGLAYAVSGGALELVADRGLPADARAELDRLALEPAWFVAQRAVQRRALVVEHDLPATVAPHAESAGTALARAGFAVAVAAPIVRARRVLGVIVAAHPTGEVADADATAFLETAANALALAVSRDEAEPRDRAAELRTAQMAALGMLAVGLADELGAPLDALALLLEDARRVAARAPSELAGELAELVQEASTSTERARALTSRLVSAVRAAEPETFELGALAGDVLSLARPTLERRGVEIDAGAVEPSAFVFGRREEIAQALLGLLLNAADASAAGPGRPLRVALRVSRDGARIVAAVEDSGVGVPAALRARIFEPFFSTKPGAVGLGLSLVKHVVVAHGGHVEVASSPLGGALFRVVLPAAAQPKTSSQPSELQRPTLGPAREPAAAAETVKPPRISERRRTLWIDDDPLFLRSIKRVLGEVDVVTASSAAEAEAELARPGPPPALVFCDIALPDRTGDQLHAALRARAPELAARFVFVTGGVIAPEVADYLIRSGCPTLLKPVDREEVALLLERRAEGGEAPTSIATLRNAPTAPVRAAPPAQPTTVPEMAAVRAKGEKQRP